MPREVPDRFRDVIKVERLSNGCAEDVFWYAETQIDAHSRSASQIVLRLFLGCGFIVLARFEKLVRIRLWFVAPPLIDRDFSLPVAGLFSYAVVASHSCSPQLTA